MIIIIITATYTFHLTDEPTVRKQVWMDAITDVYDKPVNRSQWHSGVEMRVNVWHGKKGFRMSDFTDAGYQVDGHCMFFLLWWCWFNMVCRQERHTALTGDKFKD